MAPIDAEEELVRLFGFDPHNHPFSHLRTMKKMICYGIAAKACRDNWQLLRTERTTVNTEPAEYARGNTLFSVCKLFEILENFTDPSRRQTNKDPARTRCAGDRLTVQLAAEFARFSSYEGDDPENSQAAHVAVNGRMHEFLSVDEGSRGCPAATNL